jgi:hypothetical protein
MGRLLLMLAALGVPLQAAGTAPATGREIVVCTGRGLRTVRLDDDGRPVAPGPSDSAAGCAHLWCGSRRQLVLGARQRT